MEKYQTRGFFNLLDFYNDHQVILPVHTLVYRADVGSMKGASACVESVFSGVKRLLGDFAATMSPEMLEMYVFVVRCAPHA
ncbi:hAT family dimerization domain-containing protein [bacterium]|nr:hAT family dimerization domain-containing protein [bacterium]